MKRSDFPEDFLWGTATAAYQIEGAHNADGKGPNIWDTFCQVPGAIENGDRGDDSCDHYYRWESDLELMEKLGTNAYRFSTSWSRVLPEGRGRVNQAGIDFYKRLVDRLLEMGLQPALTLYHWDLPQALQDLGGWGNRDVCKWYRDYTELIFKTLSDRVALWFTHNEPWVVSWAGHYQGRHAPGKKDPALAIQVSHNLLLSHAMAVRTFKEGYQRGSSKIGAVLNLYPVEPADDRNESAAAAKLADGIHNRWFLDPLYKGSYPADVLSFFDSKGWKFHQAPEDLDEIHAYPGDFLGVNYYFRKTVIEDRTNIALPWKEVLPPGAQSTEMGWEVHAKGMTDLLSRIRDDYAPAEMYITENGAAFPDKTVEDGIIADEDRRKFIEDHFEEALTCIRAGIPLKGFFVWSFFDNFEWARGYSKRFGLFGIDYKTQRRIPKKSALWYKAFLHSDLPG